MITRFPLLFWSWLVVKSVLCGFCGDLARALGFPVFPDGRSGGDVDRSIGVQRLEVNLFWLCKQMNLPVLPCYGGMHAARALWQYGKQCRTNNRNFRKYHRAAGEVTGLKMNDVQFKRFIDFASAREMEASHGQN
jgi:hypothetical protein